MDRFFELLKRHHLERPLWENLYFSCPREISFLQEPFLTRYYAMADLPLERLPRILAFAEKVDHHPLLRHLIWYCHSLYLWSGVFDMATLPETIDLLGEEETGLFYLLIQLTLIPELEARMKSGGYPEAYTLAAVSRIGTLVHFYAQAHHGLFGLRARSMPFMLNFLELRMFRIGRFEYTLERLGNNFPFVFRQGHENVIFCGDRWQMDAHGDRVAENTPDAMQTSLSITDTSVTGRLIDPRRGKALNEMKTISLADYHRAAGPGDVALHFHIPGGGGMTPEKCRASFADALEFYHRYFPEQQIRLIYSRSWIFNPAWLHYLPESHLASLIRLGSLYPDINNGREGLFFIFGRDDGDFNSYPRDNSMRRAMLDALADQGRLYAPGWFILPEELN